MIGLDHTPTAADQAYVKGLGATIRFTFPSINVIAGDVPTNRVGDASKGQGVSYVEDDPVRTPLSLSNDLQAAEYPALGSGGLYGLVTTHAVEAQGYSGGGVKACVADTGLDTTQSDIVPNFVKGYDAFDPSKPTVDVNQLGTATTETHATHVSGIILGAMNGSGIHGVAPEAKLLEARVLGMQPDGVTVEGSTSRVMAGVAWLASQGCKVINMSLGGGDKSQAEEALYSQIRKHGTLIVVASGNDSSKKVSCPGAYQSVVAVGAVDRDNQPASFSNTGAQLDLVAPASTTSRPSRSVRVATRTSPSAPRRTRRTRPSMRRRRTVSPALSSTAARRSSRTTAARRRRARGSRSCSAARSASQPGCDPARLRRRGAGLREEPRI